MIALTVLQPWAGLIALEAKQYETRSWKTSYRGKLAIHAGKNGAFLLDTLREWREGCGDDEFLQAFHAGIQGRYNPMDFPRGAIVAVVTLVDCVPTHILREEVSQQELSLGDFGPSRYGWKLENVQRLETPVFCSGQQGLWRMPESVAVACITQLEGVA